MRMTQSLTAQKAKEVLNCHAQFHCEGMCKSVPKAIHPSDCEALRPFVESRVDPRRLIRVFGNRESPRPDSRPGVPAAKPVVERVSRASPTGTHRRSVDPGCAVTDPSCGRDA